MAAAGTVTSYVGCVSTALSADYVSYYKTVATADTCLAACSATSGASHSLFVYGYGYALRCCAPNANIFCICIKPAALASVPTAGATCDSCATLRGNTSLVNYTPSDFDSSLCGGGNGQLSATDTPYSFAVYKVFDPTTATSSQPTTSTSNPPATSSTPPTTDPQQSTTSTTASPGSSASSGSTTDTNPSSSRSTPPGASSATSGGQTSQGSDGAPSTPPASDPGSSGSSGISTGAVAGIAAGIGVVLIAVAVVFFLVLLPRWRNQREAEKKELMSSVFLASGSGGGGGPGPGPAGSTPARPIGGPSSAGTPVPLHSGDNTNRWSSPAGLSAPYSPVEPIPNPNHSQRLSTPDLSSWPAPLPPGVQPFYPPLAPVQPSLERLAGEAGFMTNASDDSNSSWISEASTPQPFAPARTTSRYSGPGAHLPASPSPVSSSAPTSSLPHNNSVTSSSIFTGASDVTAALSAASAAGETLDRKTPLPLSEKSNPSATAAVSNSTSNPALFPAPARPTLFSGVSEITSALSAAAAADADPAKKTGKPPRDVHAWTIHEVAAALAEEGLPRAVVDVFVRNEIDGVVLQTVDSAYLAGELGFSAAGVRTRVMMAVRRIRGEPEDPRALDHDGAGGVEAGTLSPPPYLESSS